MRKRCLNIEWQHIEGAAKKKRILHLAAEDGTGGYACPISICLHDSFKSSRGLRKHLDNIHPWYYYFDNRPSIQRQIAVKLPKKMLKASTHSMPAYSLQTGIGKEFVEWLSTSCGGGKSTSEAIQVARRAMKFLMFSMGDCSPEVVLQEDFIDCCVGNPGSIVRFIREIAETWKLSSSGSLNYLKSIGDLMDFRKSDGVTDNTLRLFTASEVYIRRGIGNLSKAKKLDYSRNLDLETLILRNTWASLSELESVIPYHTPRFQRIVQHIRNNRLNDVTINDLAFTTRYITTFLFLRVKCTRPMTYKYLTIQMLDGAKKNNGYVDSTTFKTSGTYTFDTLILSADVMDILDIYVKFIRSLMSPCVDFLLVTTKGTQYTGLGTAMSLLVFQAIGKSVNPTRYRQIVESESAEKLTMAEREAISKDQRHSSEVARRIYQKRLSRDVAQDGRSCIEKLVGSGRDDHNAEILRTMNAAAEEHTKEEDVYEEILAEEVVSMIIDDEDDLDEATNCAGNPNRDVNSADVVTINAPPLDEERYEIDDYIAPNNVVHNVDIEESVLQTASTITESVSCATITTNSTAPVMTSIFPGSVSSTGSINTQYATDQEAITTEVQSPLLLPPSYQPDMDIEVKREEIARISNTTPRLLRFTPEEDSFLRQGTKKYGLSSWAKILKDEDFCFHQSRTRDALRVRAETLKIVQRKKGPKRKVRKSAA